jgi:methanethiol S-methyltransferase
MLLFLSTLSKEFPVPDYADFILRFMFFAVAHSLFASDRVKRLVRRASGKEPRWYRLIYNLLSLIVFGWVMAACRHSPVLYFVPGAASLIMYLLQIIILVLLFRCVRKTGAAAFLGFSRFRAKAAPQQLVTDGCYSLVRHPLYLFSTLFLLLNPVMTRQWALLTVMSVPYFIIGGLIEEQRLAEEFGEQYRCYRRKVPFMMPPLRLPGQTPPD